MSYNIDDTEVLILDAKMLQKDIRDIYVEYEDELAEINFITDHRKEPADADGYVKLKSFDWCASYSGRSYELLEKTILPKIVGKVKVKFIWEDGLKTTLSNMTKKKK